MMDEELRKSEKLGGVDNLTDDVIHPQGWDKYIGSTCGVVTFGYEVAVGLDGDEAVSPDEAIGVKLNYLSYMVGRFMLYKDH